MHVIEVKNKKLNCVTDDRFAEDINNKLLFDFDGVRC